MSKQDDEESRACKIAMSSCHKKWMSKPFRKAVVSVVIPTYNRETLILEAIDSVWNQTYRPIELVLIDDGSYDHTQRNILRWKREHIQNSHFKLSYYYQKNKGASTARNSGLCKSHGEFIQYLDSDDLLLPEKIIEQVNTLKEHPLADFVYAITIKINVKGKQLELIGSPLLGKVEDWVPSYNWHTSSPLFRRRVCRAIGPWDKERNMSDDLVHDARVKILGFNGIFVNKAYSIWRIHSGDQMQKRSHIFSARSSELSALKIKGLVDKFGIHNQKVNNVLARYFLRASIIMYSEGYSNDYKRCISQAKNMASGNLKVLVIIIGFISFLLPGRIMERFSSLWKYAHILRLK